VQAGHVFVGSASSPQEAVVGSELGGLVVEYLGREGLRVKKGQVLARLRTGTLEIQLSSARATLELRKQELKELENGTRKEEIAQARARVGQAQAALELSQWKSKSAEQLFARNSISDIELQEAKLPEKGAEEKLKEAQAALDLALAGPRPERILQAKARVDSAQADVARIEDDLDRHVVRAPFDGHVVAERTEVGQWLGIGDPVAELAALDTIELRLAVIEDHIKGVRIGLEVHVTFDGLPGREFKGEVTGIVPRADVRTRTFPVKVRVPNEQVGGAPLIKAGMMARAGMAIGESRQALLVPLDALVLAHPMFGKVVYVVDDQSMAKPIPVRLGLPREGLIQVTGPLQPGMKVVVKGNERLMPMGQPVRIMGN
jgi:multidrug efflux pump subunit AcrA (membrane-fusion protein)